MLYFDFYLMLRAFHFLFGPIRSTWMDMSTAAEWSGPPGVAPWLHVEEMQWKLLKLRVRNLSCHLQTSQKEVRDLVEGCSHHFPLEFVCC